MLGTGPGSAAAGQADNRVRDVDHPGLEQTDQARVKNRRLRYGLAG